MSNWTEGQQTLYPVKFPMEGHLHVDETTGLKLDTSTVEHMLPKSKPQTREEMLRYIENFERHSDRWIDPSTWAMNIKLWSAVRIPSELQIGDTWFEDTMNIFWDADYEYYKDTFEEEHPGYTFWTQGRSGGWLALGTKRGKYAPQTMPKWEELEYDYDSDYYEKLVVPRETWIDNWKSIEDYVKNWLYRERYPAFEKALQQAFIGELMGTQTVLNKRAKDIYHEALELQRKWDNMWRSSSEKATNRLQDMNTQLGYFVRELVYVPTNVDEVFYAEKIVDTLKRFSGNRLQTEQEILQELKRQYTEKHGKCPAEVAPAETWTDEAVEELFDLLWDFATTAAMMAREYAYGVWQYAIENYEAEKEEE